MRNGIVRWMLLLLVIVAASGCAVATGSQGPGAAPKGYGQSSQAGGNVPLRAIWWGSQDRHDKTMKAWEAYSAKHPEVRVTSEFSGGDSYWDKLAVKVASGDAPDLIQMDYAYLNDYGLRGALLDLNGLVGHALDVSQMDPALLESGKLDGKLYSVCLGGNTLAMHVNKTILDRAGLPVPSMDWTWQDFEEMGRQFKARLGGEGMYISPDQSGQTNVFQYWLRQQGKSPALYNGTRFGFVEADLVEWFQYWARLRDEGLIPNGEVTASYGGTNAPLEQSMWVRQKTPFQWGWSNEYERYATVIKDEVVATSYPRGGPAEGHYPKCSQFFSVSAQSRYPKEAAALISWLINDPEAVGIVAANRGVPVTPPAREALRQVGLSKYDAVTFDVTQQISDFAAPTPQPEPRGHPDITRLFIRTAEEIQFGRKTPEEGARAVVTEGTRILEKANQ